jgi:hypothetical protein
MSNKGVIWALIAAAIGAIYLMLAGLGPLKNANLGLGLTAGLSAQKLAGGYSMANVVLFIIFIVVIVLCAIVWAGNRKKGA